MLMKQSIYMPEMSICEIEDLLQAHQGLQKCFISGKQQKHKIVRRWKGDGITIPTNFVITLYRSNGGFTACPSDMVSFLCLLNGKNPWEQKGLIITVDDSGWGCPVGGVIIGMISESDSVIHHDIIPYQEFLKPPNCYMKTTANTLVNMIKEYCEKQKLKQDDVIIEICPGSIFTIARSDLYHLGWMIRTCQVKGRLQDGLKVLFQNYLISIGVPPKLVDKDYGTIAAWAQENSFPLIKWDYVQKEIGENNGV